MSEAVPETQTAVIQSDYGHPRDVLTLSTSQPVTPPGPHQVQVRIVAASINPVDVKQLHGNMAMVLKLHFPLVPGRDFSGVVTAVGSAVTRLHVGDEVYGDAETDKGTYQQFANISEKDVALKPKSLSFNEAAVVPLAAMTALGALEKAEVQGSKVVVIGASGGVGLFAVQIARHLGAASVVGVCSGKNADLVKEMGAETIVDYTTTKLSESITDKSVDIVFDCVGGKAQYEEAEKVLKSKGRFITITGDNSESKVTVGAVLSTIGQVGGRKLSGLFSGHSYHLYLLSPSYQMLDRVSALITEKGLKTNIDNSFGLNLEGVLGMYTQIEGKRTRGKLLLEVGKAEAPSTSSSSSSTITSTSSTASTAPATSSATTASAATLSMTSASSGPIVESSTPAAPGVASSNVREGSIEAAVEESAKVDAGAPTSVGVASEATHAPTSDEPAAQ